MLRKVITWLRARRVESPHDEFKRAGSSDTDLSPQEAAERAMNRSTWMRAGGGGTPG